MALTAELVARCERSEPDPGPAPGYEPLTDNEYDIMAHALLKRRSSGPLWVFAYGSLMWKPAFTSLEHRRATVFG
jgi:cation transport protein ChaC